MIRKVLEIQNCRKIKIRLFRHCAFEVMRAAPLAEVCTSPFRYIEAYKGILIYHLSQCIRTGNMLKGRSGGRAHIFRVSINLRAQLKCYFAEIGQEATLYTSHDNLWTAT